jgi:transcriptional regulator of heat shock response
MNTQKKDIDINTRQIKLLFALIKEYCEKGETIGSKELKEKYGFEFSSATIRNELVILRDLGYLYQPFINSPSCPTEKSYKLFVNQLISGLGQANKNQLELHKKILELQSKQENMNKEIARLLSSQTDTLSFSLTKNNESISGIKHLLKYSPESAPVSTILDFLDNIDLHKHKLLEGDNTTSTSSKKGKVIKTVFGEENTEIPLGEGYTLLATEIMVNNEKTVIGLISPTHLLANVKKLQTIESISELFQNQIVIEK